MIEVSTNTNTLLGGGNETLCVLVRTYAGHGLSLSRQVIGWAKNAQSVTRNDTIQHLSIYIINTHHIQNRTDDQYLADLMDRTAELVPNHVPMDLDVIPLPQDFQLEPLKYGYDATNYLLDLLLLKHTKRRSCDRFLITNGDNSYNDAFLKEINAHIQQLNDADLIAVQFTSHHQKNQVVNLRFKIGGIDLGAVVVKRRVFTKLCPGRKRGPLRFREWDRKVPEKLWFNSDGGFFEEAVQQCGATTSVIEQILFQHQ